MVLNARSGTSLGWPTSEYTHLFWTREAQNHQAKWPEHGRESRINWAQDVLDYLPHAHWVAGGIKEQIIRHGLRGDPWHADRCDAFAAAQSASGAELLSYGRTYFFGNVPSEWHTGVEIKIRPTQPKHLPTYFENPIMRQMISFITSWVPPPMGSNLASRESRSTSVSRI